MNYELDEVAKNLEDELCSHCREVRYDNESGCYDCHAPCPESKRCVKHTAYERIMKLLKNVEDAVDEARDDPEECDDE